LETGGGRGKETVVGDTSSLNPRESAAGPGGAETFLVCRVTLEEGGKKIKPSLQTPNKKNKKTKKKKKKKKNTNNNQGEGEEGGVYI